MNAPEIDNSSLAGLVTDAIESALAMATVQEGYAKKAGELGLQIIHKANAKAQRQIASTIRALQTERDATEAALAAMTERERVLRAALTPFARYMRFEGVRLDLDDKGNPVPDDQGVGWVYLTHGDFRRARAALQHKDATHGPE